MGASLAKKFTFDLDLGDKSKKTSLIKEERLRELINEAKQKAYQEGFRAGEQSELSRHNQALEAAMSRLISECEKIISSRHEMQQTLIGQAVDLASKTGKKLAANLIEKQPEVELDALIKECLSSLEDVPHLVIHCHQDMVQYCHQAAEKYMQTSRFSGNLVVMGNEEMALSDAKIEWVDGGLVRSVSEILKHIDGAIQNYFKAHNIEQNNCPQNIDESKEKINE